MDPSSVKKLKVQVSGPACMLAGTEQSGWTARVSSTRSKTTSPPRCRDRQIGAHESLSVSLVATQELKDALSERGLDTTGLKPVLVDRLESALRAEQPNGEAAPNGTAEPAEEPMEDVIAPDTAAAEADDAAPASAVSTVWAVPGEVAKDASRLVISD